MTARKTKPATRAAVVVPAGLAAAPFLGDDCAAAPLKPTPGMISAGVRAGEGLAVSSVFDIYQAMISVAKVNIPTARGAEGA